MLWARTLSLSLWLAAWPALAQTPANPDWVLNQATCAAAVTPSDTANLPAGPAPCATWPVKGIFTAGTGGGAACVLVASLQDTASVTYVNVQPGLVYPFRALAVKNTNTTCTGIVALY